MGALLLSSLAHPKLFSTFISLPSPGAPVLGTDSPWVSAHLLCTSLGRDDHRV